MKALAICNKGCEDITLLEVKDILGCKGIVKEGCVEFSATRLEDIGVFSYKAQSAVRVMMLLGEMKVEMPEDIKQIVNEISWKEWIEGKTFVVRCLKVDSEFSGQEIEAKTGEFILENVKAKVELNNPDISVLVYLIGKQCYVGIDFCGFEVSKRDYKIFNLASSLKGTVAYCLVRLSGFKDGMRLLDPFCGDGTIPIEAALWARGGGVNYFRKEKFAFDKFLKMKLKDTEKEGDARKWNIHALDKTFHSVSAAKKNAKIANINKEINFSRLDVEWLDTKFNEKEVDVIVTNPPKLGKNTNAKDVLKVYKEFFHQAEFVLNPKGKIVIISDKKDELVERGKEKGFAVSEEREVWSGKQKYYALIFKKMAKP